MRVLDRTGLADLGAIAAEVASTGAEVVEIGNAAVFDAGPTQVVVPRALEEGAVTELASWTGAATVHDNDVESDDIVTLIIGADYLNRR